MDQLHYKGVIFDMDGTLVDNIAFHKKAWLLFLKKHGIAIGSDAFAAQNHGTIDEMIVRFFGKEPPQTIAAFGKEKEQTYRDLYRDHIEEVAGLTAFLQQLKSDGIKIGLATNGDAENIDFVVDSLNIREFFDVITGGDDVAKGKPDPEVFVLTLQKMGLDAQDAIAIEDSAGGIHSAAAAGLRVVGITTTETRETLLQNGCCATIRDYFELLKNRIIVEQ